MSKTFKEIDLLCVNALRTLSIDVVQKANSGHPGLPLGAAPMAYVLWARHLKHAPKEPSWTDRDRFVLSAGHGSALLYSLLHLSGYDLSLDDLKSFRQLGSRTPGHPESFLTRGVEATTGPLGQGAANAVGMAIAERLLAHHFNRPGHAITDHRTYALVSDGDLMEGIASEAASLAGHLKLGKLIFLYDSNDISLDGPTALSFSSEDVGKRYKAYGWQVINVENGDDDLRSIDKAISKAKSDTSKPSIVIIKTIIGYGSSKKGTSAVHGAPLGDEGVARTKEALGWDPQKFFYVPGDVYKHFHDSLKKNSKANRDWHRGFDEYRKACPEKADEWRRLMDGELPDGWDSELPSFKAGESLATRQVSSSFINAVAPRMPLFIGGSADLSSSCLTVIKDGGNFDGQTGEGRNIYYGVREHAMGAIANGMAYHGGVRAFVSTFLVFSDYMRPAVRLAAMNKLSVIYVWTHDSIAVGEDGPTHQPVEHVMSLRLIPGLHVFRPADAPETVEAWRWIMSHRDCTSALILTRQKVPVLDRTKLASASELAHGAYILSDPPDKQPVAIVIATGSEVHVALKAQQMLATEGIPVRVVSMPCWEIFKRESSDYQNSVLPPSITARISVEAGVTPGWDRWVGSKGIALGIDCFGVSAPGEVAMAHFGFTPENVAFKLKELLK